MKNLIQDDGAQVLQIVAGAARTGGKMYIEGSLVGVAVSSEANGDKYALHTKGVYSYAKLTTDVIIIGAKLYLDTTNDWLTLTAGAFKAVGHAVEAAGNGVTSVVVRLNETAV